MKNYLETERLILKILGEANADQVLDYYIRNQTFLDEWEPAKSESFYTLDFQAKLLEVDTENMKRGNCLRFWIYKKDAPDRIIGSVGFNNIVLGPFLSCFLGYKLDKDELNNGCMTEALREGIDFVFNELGLHRIEANIMPKNVRSLRVTEKLGFYNEGLARNYLKINGKWEDHIHMVLLNDKV